MLSKEEMTSKILELADRLNEEQVRKVYNFIMLMFLKSE